jgi:hypothetical protein
VHDDGASDISEIPEDMPLTRGYDSVFFKHTGQSRKRKREIDAENESGVIEKFKTKQPRSPSTPAEAIADASTKPGTSNAAAVQAKIGDETSALDAPSLTTKPDGQKKDEDELKPGIADDMGNYFYLVKPHTSGAQRVLIPLSPTDALQQSLRNQTVLEFPTVQVLSHPPDALPSLFILEEIYLDKFKKQQDEMQRLVAEVEEPKLEKTRTEHIHSTIDPIPNASDILATLERDIGGSVS